MLFIFGPFQKKWQKMWHDTWWKMVNLSAMIDSFLKLRPSEVWKTWMNMIRHRFWKTKLVLVIICCKQTYFVCCTPDIWVFPQCTTEYHSQGRRFVSVLSSVPVVLKLEKNIFDTQSMWKIICCWICCVALLTILCHS